MLYTKEIIDKMNREELESERLRLLFKAQTEDGKKNMDSIQQQIEYITTRIHDGLRNAKVEGRLYSLSELIAGKDKPAPKPQKEKPKPEYPAELKRRHKRLLMIFYSDILEFQTGEVAQEVNQDPVIKDKCSKIVLGAVSFMDSKTPSELIRFYERLYEEFIRNMSTSDTDPNHDEAVLSTIAGIINILGMF